MNLAAVEVGTQRGITMSLFVLFVLDHSRHHVLGQPADPQRHRLLRRRSHVLGLQNGMAIGGDYMSAASFLGIAGIIALSGYDGFLYSIGFLVAWLVALLLVAELMRNSGKYTMADVLAFRMRQRPVRTAAAVSTVTVSIFYLLAQMVGAGALVALLLGIKQAQTFLGMDAEHREGRDDHPHRHPHDHLRDRRRHEGHDVRPDRQGVHARWAAPH